MPHTSAKRLFQITDTADRKPIPGFFENKEDARSKRRELNDEVPGKPYNFRYVISPGPDHRNYRG